MAIKRLSFILLFSGLFSGSFGAQAQTINAASCNESDVAKALSQIAADGTTVNIPAGTCTWSTSLQYTQTNSFTLQGAGAVSGTGSASTPNGVGSDQTILQDNINRSSAGDQPMLGVTTLAGKSFRLTGIAFGPSTQNSANETYHGIVIVNGSSTSVRIDHNHFNQNYAKDLGIAGALNGVADHNQFDTNDNNVDEFSMQLSAGNWAGDSSGNGNGSWADSSHWGSSQFFFIENNNYQTVNPAIGPNTGHGFAFDCVPAGRFVFRDNFVGNHMSLQLHGTGSGNDWRGCRAYELYNNVFQWCPPSESACNSGADYFALLVDFESGTSLNWGNTSTGFRSYVQADIVRANNQTYNQGTPPNGWGYCGSLGPSNWDQNANSTGYACVDGIGRGKGDLLSGTFPNKVNSTTGQISWPNQALDPVYLWMNTYNPVPQESSDSYWANYPQPATLVENRDYYLELPNYNESAKFNGTAGTGFGTLAARPIACTPSVGYWATDTNTFYQCSGTNTWTTYYTPYTYPHPLTQGTTTQIAPPTGVQVHVDD